jgi:3-hydroxyisobutyrate dehydrogenase-like beta-hydroxyacid dehydrogenase
MSTGVAVLGTGRMRTSLTGADAVRAAYRGPTGALAAARGQVFVEMSTSGPDVLAELEPQLGATGSTLIDAPILGGPTVVLRGGAAILVGGAPAAVERAGPLLGLLGEVRHAATWKAERGSSWWPTASWGR